MDGLSPEEVGNFLHQVYGIYARAGLDTPRECIRPFKGVYPQPRGK